MYASRSFKTKKALKEAVAKGAAIGVFNPGLGGEPPRDGKATLSGPNYQPHTWYAEVQLKDGIIVSVR